MHHVGDAEKEDFVIKNWPTFSSSPYLVPPKLAEKILKLFISREYSHLLLLSHEGSGRTTTLKIVTQLLDQQPTVYPFYFCLSDIEKKPGKFWNNFWEVFSSSSHITELANWGNWLSRLKQKLPESAMIPIIIDDADILLGYLETWELNNFMGEFLKNCIYPSINNPSKIMFLFSGTPNFLSYLNEGRLFRRDLSLNRAFRRRGKILDTQELYFDQAEVEILLQKLRKDRNAKISATDFAQELFNLTRGHPELTFICLKDLEAYCDNRTDEIVAQDFTNSIFHRQSLPVFCQSKNPYKSILNLFEMKLANKTRKPIRWSFADFFNCSSNPDVIWLADFLLSHGFLTANNYQLEAEESLLPDPQSLTVEIGKDPTNLEKQTFSAIPLLASLVEFHLSNMKAGDRPLSHDQKSSGNSLYGSTFDNLKSNRNSIFEG
ncbi:hypothetical protein G9A89_010742 [Geosiphon pyriformis]|nr:hypothetical protein G9A89_010742 [Geosiphon pyriformis]